ncbi:MAG: radical SAM protein [Candidatus Cellulosilyticum pullistercoris]|uniref:Radical SAM protein n=1 Tax=Candidatus Cellulosilyticum pullistercoris TaxID=2838521 RepID=A0A9E2K9T9_9FIRM|nr:radical SAM protein [Candidatus Cellulosilyticum pullistercoris]
MRSFKKVYIEITNICNLNCDFCPKTTRKPEITTKEKFLHIIKSVKPYTDYIYLHLLGEPTMHPELKDYLQISAEHGLKVNLTTNGTLIHKVKDILIEAPALRQVNISLHSFEGNELEISMEAYLEGIINFINEAISKSKVICSLRLWNMDSETLKGKNERNQEIISMLEEKLEIDFNIAEALRGKSGIKLKQGVYLNMAEKFEWPDKERVSSNGETFCYGLRDQVGILVDGTVVPCCLDSEGHIALGNIFEVPFKEIITSERSQKIYNGFSNRQAVEKLCQSCSYAKRYNKINKK